MPRRVSMGELVTRCKQRCDMENSSLIGDAEWKTLVSEQYADLYSVICDSGLRYFETSTRFTTDGSNHVAEPEDHLSTLGLDYIVNATTDRLRCGLPREASPPGEGRQGHDRSAARACGVNAV